MIGFDYNKVSGSVILDWSGGDEWCQLQVVKMGNRTVYRKGRYPKCKRCRKINTGGMALCAPSKGIGCPACGNPFIYKLRTRILPNGGRFTDSIRAA